MPKGYPLSGFSSGWFKKGRSLTDEEKKKISLATKGKKKSPETREKMAMANRRRARLRIGYYFESGEKNPNWRGGTIKSNGYVTVPCKEHPLANKDGYIMQHRLVMEKQIGRHLRRDEVVHHINGDKKDNRLENLMLFPNDMAHRKHHELMRNQNV